MLVMYMNTFENPYKTLCILDNDDNNYNMFYYWHVSDIFNLIFHSTQKKDIEKWLFCNNQIIILMQTTSTPVTLHVPRIKNNPFYYHINNIIVIAIEFTKSLYLLVEQRMVVGQSQLNIGNDCRYKID